jgi:hypothetical protein
MSNDNRDKWIKGVNVAFTYCDAEGIIRDMNPVAAATFAESGGEKLIGKNALDCHPGASRSKMQDLLDQQLLNVYTIEKDGRKKMIYQAPVTEDGKYIGVVEISLPIPEEIPHFKRN